MQSIVDRVFEQQLDLAVKQDLPKHAPYPLRNSNQHNFCARAFVLWEISGVKDVNVSSYRFDAYVDIGTAVHTVNQRWAGRQGILFGNWQCSHCGFIIWMTLGEPSVCPGCTKHYSMVYRELTLIEPNTGLSGHCDGILQIPGIDGRLLWEIKSIGQKYVTDPTFDPDTSEWYWWHSLQANNYFWMARLGYPADHFLIPEEERFEGETISFPDLTWILHTYVGRDDPTVRRHFLHTPSQASFDASIAPITLAKEALRAGYLPPGRCVDSSDKLSRNCVYRSMCFSPVLSQILPTRD